MWRAYFSRFTASWIAVSFLVVLVLAGLYGLRLLQSPAYGAPLGNRAVQINNNIASEQSNYRLSFTVASADTLGSIRIEFCMNSTLEDEACIAPNGQDASSAVLTEQQGESGFTISSASTDNEIILTRTPVLSTQNNLVYTFTNIKNPADAGTYFVRVHTYASDDATGTASNFGGMAFSIDSILSISATVPPYLTFCTGITITDFNCANAVGDYIDLGELSSRRTSSGTSQMLVTTNARDGYVISVGGTTLASGSNIITALTGGDVARAGVGQFGFNLRANSTPAIGSNPSGPGVGQPKPDYDIPNIYRLVDGDTIASYTGPDNLRQFTASYIVNVPSGQAPGVYVTTLTYVCFAHF
jgi:hypothetical protein